MNEEGREDTKEESGVKDLMLPKVSSNNRVDVDIDIGIQVGTVLDKLTKVAVLRNLFTVSLAFMFLFSAFNSFVFLQSSLNVDDGLGSTGVAVLNVSMALTGLFLTPVTLSWFSDKRVVTVSVLGYIIYVATGFYPTWATVIPASIIVGVAGAHLWLAVQTYITDIARQYARLTNTRAQDRLHLFLGIFYGFTYTSNISGNLFSSLAFQRKSLDEKTEDEQGICGPNFCPYKEMNDTVIIPPTQTQIYMFTGFCAGISLLSLVLTSLCVSDISSSSSPVSSAWKKVRLVTVHLFTSKNQHLLLLASVLDGLATGFTASDFTSAYISCPYGIENVGFVMMTFGVSQSLFSIIFGKLNQYLGHIPIYILGYICQLAAYLTLIFWNPKQSEYGVVYVISVLFGIGAAVNMPVVSALYNIYFPIDKREVAISSFRVLNAVGWAVAFGYSSWLCTQYKIYVLICVLTLALISLTALHIIHKKESRRAKSKQIDQYIK